MTEQETTLTEREIAEAQARSEQVKRLSKQISAQVVRTGNPVSFKIQPNGTETIIEYPIDSSETQQ